MDNLTQALTTLQQYQNDGNDLAQLLTAAQSLLDTGKTTLGLNQWKLTDKPRMEEFNEDNRIVDQELHNLRGDLTKKAEKTDNMIKTYASLTILGLNISSTLMEIHNKMEANSLLICYIDEPDTNIYPLRYGTLTVKKSSVVTSEFSFLATGGGPQYFIASVYNNIEISWKKIALASV